MPTAARRGSSERPPIDVLWCSNQRMRAGNGWSYPPNVEKKLRELTDGKRVLQLFGGMSRWGVKLDLDHVTRPHVRGDAWMPPFVRDAFDVVIIDPPYHSINQQMKRELLRGAAYVARERLIWFHTMWIASFSSAWPLERAWLVRVGDSCACRCVQVFQSVGEVEKPRPRHWFSRGPAIRYNRWIAGEQRLQF